MKLLARAWTVNCQKPAPNHSAFPSNTREAKISDIEGGYLVSIARAW